MDMTQFYAILWGIVGTIGTGLATWLTAYLVGLLNQKIKDKKAELGTSAMRDFDFHTAHIYNAIVETLAEHFGEDAKPMVQRAVNDYIELFGEEAYDVLMEFDPSEF